MLFSIMVPAPSAHEIQRRLSEHMRELRSRYGVRRLGLFGSWIRGEASVASDVDVLVEFERPTFDRYMDLKFFLEELLGCPVDLVTRDALKPRVRPEVEREAVHVT